MIKNWKYSQKSIENSTCVKDVGGAVYIIHMYQAEILNFFLLFFLFVYEVVKFPERYNKSHQRLNQLERNTTYQKNDYIVQC